MHYYIRCHPFFPEMMWLVTISIILSLAYFTMTPIHNKYSRKQRAFWESYRDVFEEYEEIEQMHIMMEIVVKAMNKSMSFEATKWIQKYRLMRAKELSKEDEAARYKWNVVGKWYQEYAKVMYPTGKPPWIE